MPNETNWQDITRRLDISQASETDACNHKTRVRGRAIRKVNYQFTVPAVNINLTAAGVNSFGCLFHQFNYTAPQAFRILDWTSAQATLNLTNLALVCVRWRSGNTAYRYRLMVTKDSQTENLFDNFYAVVRAPRYAGERIGANFSIELWSYFAGGTVILNDMIVTTGILALPDNSETRVKDIALANTVTRAQLDEPMPEVLPTTYTPNSHWLTN